MIASWKSEAHVRDVVHVPTCLLRKCCARAKRVAWASAWQSTAAGQFECLGHTPLCVVFLQILVVATTDGFRLGGHASAGKLHAQPKHVTTGHSLQSEDAPAGCDCHLHRSLFRASCFRTAYQVLHGCAQTMEVLHRTRGRGAPARPSRSVAGTTPREIWMPRWTHTVANYRRCSQAAWA